MLSLLLTGVSPSILALGILTVPQGRERWLGATRTFALAAALMVIFATLLPSAAASLGAWAFVVMVGGMALPTITDMVVSRFRKQSTAGVGFEAGYIALWLHQLVDGLQMGALGPTMGNGVVLAIAAHGAPLVAATALACLQHRDRWWAVQRGLWLAVPVALGIVGAGVIHSETLTELTPWLGALVAGLLLHVLGHGLEAAAPRTTADRTVDLLAVAAGLAVTMALLPGNDGHAHGHGHAHAHASALDVSGVLWTLVMDTAPMLLIGLIAGAALQAFGTVVPARWLTKGGHFILAIRGAILGAPLPVCACGILPVADGLARQRASAAFVVAFLIATPELGLETLALSVRFLGWPFAMVRIIGAVIAAIVAALVIATLYSEHDHSPPHGRDLKVAGSGTWWSRLLGAFDELVIHVGPWVAIGLIAAAYVQVYLGDAQLLALTQSGLDMPLVTLATVPMYVCASAATPMAGILWTKGMSSGAVLAGLLLGPATNVATLGFLRNTYGLRATVSGLGAMIGFVWCLGWMTSWLLPIAPHDLADASHAHNPVTTHVLWGVALILIFTRSIWQVGLRSWLSTLGGGHDHGHHHGHDHGHHHGHDHGHHHGHGHDHACDHGHGCDDDDPARSDAPDTRVEHTPH